MAEARRVKGDDSWSESRRELKALCTVGQRPGVEAKVNPRIREERAGYTRKSKNKLLQCDCVDDLQGVSGIQNRYVGSDELIKTSGGASIRGRATSGGEEGKGHEVVVLIYMKGAQERNEGRGISLRVCCWLTRGLHFFQADSGSQLFERGHDFSLWY